MAWYKDWFNSKYYHLLYKNRDHNEAALFLDNISNEFKNKNAKILDVACGKGRHAKYLNNLGFDVTGIDLSVNSIKYAKEYDCLLYTSPSPRDATLSRMPSSA